MTDRLFSDEELTAFLDGEAPDDLRSDIDQALQHDAGLSDRLARLDIPVPALISAFDQILHQSPQPPDLPESEPQRSVTDHRGWMSVLGGAAAGAGRRNSAHDLVAGTST